MPYDKYGDWQQATSDDVPNEEADPAFILQKMEEHLVNKYHMNIQGNPVMCYFLDENMLDDQLRANVLPSLAWMADTTVINLARAQFFRDYTEFKQGVDMSPADAYDSFIGTFIANLELGDAGTEFSDGLTRDLVQLMSFAPKLHDMAELAQSAVMRVYNPKSYEALLSSEKVGELKAESRQKLAALAKYAATDDDAPEGTEPDPADVKEAMDVVLARAARQAAESFENRKRINPVVLGLIGCAERHVSDNVEFYQLDKQLQLRLVNSTITGIKRAQERLATFNSIPVEDFMHIMKEGRQLVKKLNEVAKSYRDVEESAVIQAQQRNAELRKAKDLAKKGGVLTEDAQAQVDRDAALATQTQASIAQSDAS